MPKIRSIRGARGWGRRLKLVPYAPTVTTTQVPGAWVRDFGCTNPNWWSQYGAPWFAANPGHMLDPAGCVNGGINVYTIVNQNEYSCPLGGTYNATTGMCQ